jgi:hypothetical protein
MGYRLIGALGVYQRCPGAPERRQPRGTFRLDLDGSNRKVRGVSGQAIRPRFPDWARLAVDELDAVFREGLLPGDGVRMLLPPGGSEVRHHIDARPDGFVQSVASRTSKDRLLAARMSRVPD